METFVEISSTGIDSIVYVVSRSQQRQSGRVMLCGAVPDYLQRINPQIDADSVTVEGKIC